MTTAGLSVGSLWQCRTRCCPNDFGLSGRLKSSCATVFNVKMLFLFACALFLVLYTAFCVSRPQFAYFIQQHFSTNRSENKKGGDEDNLTYVKAKEEYASQLNASFERIPREIADVDCDGIASGDSSNDTLQRLKSIKYAFDKEKRILNASADTFERCDYIRHTFGFNAFPLSEEERQFPLGYAMLVYKWVDEVLYMLSAFYHPQNLYCIAVDTSKDPRLFGMLTTVAGCFSNVIVLNAGKVGYYEFSVVEAVFACLKKLCESRHRWKYFQYLSNFDLPLKTNREMVRIFKRFRGAVNVGFEIFMPYRVDAKADKIPKDITLYKSSLSAVFSRESADFMAQSTKVAELLEFLNGTIVPDESIWGTIAANPNIGMPHSFDGKKWVPFLLATPYHNATFPYYLSRYQAWERLRECKGRLSMGSCVYGVGDLARLLRRPELVAHKLYLDFEPVAFFCLYKLVRERALRPIEWFVDEPYGNVPWLRKEPPNDTVSSSR